MASAAASQVKPELATVLRALAVQAAHVAGADQATVFVCDAFQPERLSVGAACGPEAPLGDDGRPQAAACLALRTDGDRLGVLAVGAPDDEVPDPGALAETAAALAHVLAQNEASERLARTIWAGIEALASLLDLRDGYAARDAGEIAELAREVGARLGIAGDPLAELGIAGRLHDVGKIGVPDRILQKPGALESDERAIMERHAVWGAELLDRIPGFEGVAAIVRSHHERWDGNGYPAGLAGEETPLPARIIGACEAYRAMTTDRPYRRALSPDRALELLRQGAGTHFDPQVVETLVAVLAERGDAAPAPAPAPPAGPRGTAVQVPPPGVGERHSLPAAFERLEHLPALTESRDRLLALLRGERPSAGAIVAAVEADIALVIAVLRMANRGRPARAVISVRAAVEALTPEGVEQLATEMTTAGFFERGGGAWPIAPEPFRAHATAVQRSLERVAREVGLRDIDELLVAATLHDVGRLVLAHAQREYPDKILAGARTPDERVRAERRALGVDHALVGGVLLRRWGLPNRLASAVERHHSDDEDTAPALLRLADQLAHYAHGRPIDPQRLLEGARRVGLSNEQLRTVLFELPAGTGTEKPREREPCPLTEKELQALQGLAAGKVYKEIAADLGIATSTVRSHLHKTYRKIGAGDRAQAVLMATERGWL